MRDHGGNLDAALARFGGTDWIDLSTGINRQPYPVPLLPGPVWTDLPRASATAALTAAAQAAFGTTAPVLALAGAQAAIQLVPRLFAPGRATVLTPTYNEHAANLRSAGWQVTETGRLSGLAGADLAVVVNPNNPDGRAQSRADLLALAGQVGCLVVDESFVEPKPALSMADAAGAGIIVLRSFGKFWGLAGLRLGFVIGDPAHIARLSDMAGPWPVSGAALELGRIALADTKWQQATIQRLNSETTQLDTLAEAAGWRLVGGTALFRTYATPDAATAQAALARARIWSRIFPYSAQWLRLGLPGTPVEWARLTQALAGVSRCRGPRPPA